MIPFDNLRTYFLKKKTFSSFKGKLIEHDLFNLIFVWEKNQNYGTTNLD